MLGEIGVVLAPGEGTLLAVGPHRVRVVQRATGGSPYALVEWLAPPAVPGPPLHLHRATDEAFYVLEGIFGFQVGDRTVDGPAGAYLFVPRGQAHTFWNQGSTPARYLMIISPPDFAPYFEELAELLAAAGDAPEEAISVRQQLSARYDIRVVGPSRQAGA